MDSNGVHCCAARKQFLERSLRAIQVWCPDCDKSKVLWNSGTLSNRRSAARTCQELADLLNQKRLIAVICKRERFTDRLLDEFGGIFLGALHWKLLSVVFTIELRLLTSQTSKRVFLPYFNLIFLAPN